MPFPEGITTRQDGLEEQYPFLVGEVATEEGQHLDPAYLSDFQSGFFYYDAFLLSFTVTQPEPEPEPEPDEPCCPPLEEPEPECAPTVERPYTNSPCHAPDCMQAWEDGPTLWDGGGTWWDCDVPPEPDPEPPECDQPAFAHITWNDDLDLTPTDTLEASTVATVAYPLRLTSDRDGVVTVYEESFWVPGQNPARYDTEGNKTWEWTRPAPGTAYDATSDSTGVTYIAFDSELFTGESSDPRGRIFKVNPDGTDVLLAYVDATALTSHEFSAPHCTVASVALSSDGSVLYAIVLAGDAEDPAILAGFDTTDGALLWDVPLVGGP